MTKLSDEAKQRIADEEQVLSTSIEVLTQAREEEYRKLNRHSNEARELTAQIVGASRDVDKQMLASDESVSHQLSTRAREGTQKIEELLEEPYFARLILHEQTPSGPKTIQFKIGKHANIDANIIDWKNAPLARLYYEYEEGEEYLEDIRGRERCGTIAKKTKIKIKKGVLRQISCPVGTFRKNDDNTWEGSERVRGNKEGQFTLPDILSLITAEQFRLITEDANEPIILHGVAGSGKTSVALHRLAWQLEQDHSATPLALTPTDILATYVKNSLSGLEVEIPVLTITSFFESLYRQSSLSQSYSIKNMVPEHHIARIKGSRAFLSVFLTHIPESTSFSECLLNALSDTKAILEADATHLLSPNSIRAARDLAVKMQEIHVLDASDLPLALIREKLHGSLDSVWYSHIFLDEFQESSATELALVGSLLKNIGNLTVTGDAEQQTRESVTYNEAIEALLMCAKNKHETSSVYPLNISHRSTLQILRFADALLGKERTTEGRQGKAPLVIQCDTRQNGFDELVSWLGRVEKHYPGETVAVLTSHNEESKNLLSLLSSKLSERVCLIEDAPRTTDGMVLITSIQNSKGLEFPHVAIWNVGQREYPNKSWAQRKLYLAATRAEEHLTLFYWQNPSPLIPSAHLKLHRLYDARKELN